MNPTQHDLAVEDLRRRLSRRSVRTAILFGSVARNEATEDSDLDVLIIPRNERDEEPILGIVREVEAHRGVRVAALFVDPSLRGLDRQFVDSILREGKPLVGSMPRVDVRELDLEPVRLVSIDLKHLPQKEKVRLERELFGYRTTKRVKDRTYERSVPGKLAVWGGRKIGRGTLLIPEAAVAEFAQVLRAYKAKRMIIPIWIQRP